jgi:hypothetical protein
MASNPRSRLIACLPSAWHGRRARQLRALGRYDRETLARYYLAWKRTRGAPALVAYLRFRHDLGLPLPKRHLEGLLVMVERLPPWLSDHALGLIAERAPERLTDTPPERRAHAALTLPALAAAERQLGRPAPAWLAAIAEHQDEWRAQLRAELLARRGAGIGVVGNAGGLIGAAQGARIDALGFVIRFNIFRGPDSSDADIGRRVDAWVAKPTYVGVLPDTPRWSLVSGVDIRYAKQDLSVFQPILDAGRPLLSFPLSIWRQLVAKLGAPPTAGLMTLAWLRDILGDWEAIEAFGFTLLESGAAPYHHARPGHVAGIRHAWERERDLIETWRAQGLLAHPPIPPRDT